MEAVPSALFTVIDQDVDLELDFATKTIFGKTSIRIEPNTADLKVINIRCRQASIQSIKVDNFPVTNYKYRDPYQRMTLLPQFSVHQHHQIDCGIERKPQPGHDNSELSIPLPPKLKLQSGPTLSLSLKTDTVRDPALNASFDDGPKYRTFTITIEYVILRTRDGINWIGLSESDNRFPHVYSYSNSLAHTMATYLFPCLDTAGIRHPWKLSIICPRTVSDISFDTDSPQFQRIRKFSSPSQVRKFTKSFTALKSQFQSSFSDVERSMDFSVICSGEMEESDAPHDLIKTHRKWIFNCKSAVAARHIGFAIGPFDMVDLTKFRESDQDDKLGQSAYNIHGFCLPGRDQELRNVCIPVAACMDRMSTNTVFFPFETSYRICFVDDLPFPVVNTAAFSICSSKLLVPENVIDPFYNSARELMRAVVSQWIGVKITALTLLDSWIIIGGSYFLADHFMMYHMFGRNEHRFRLKQAADKVCQMDNKKPSIYAIGGQLDLDSEVYEFIKLKAPTVLHILHNRIIKANGRNGVDKMFWRALLDDQTGRLDNGEIDTERLVRIAEKVAHAKFEPFFQQWVYGSGCPIMRVSQRFNKKKTVVELFISQTPDEREVTSDLTEDTFITRIKEKEENFLLMESQRLFTGPMTIRIHEADGTPYEHIVDIKEMQTKVEIPYNTKYKRLKRNKKDKKKANTTASTAAAAAAAINANDGNDDQDDALLYCLGDVLQTEEDIQEWDLADWTKEDESKMSDEHYEWIRLDKDFEWIASIAFNQPHYMWVSQLQQDNDVVAQVESINYLNKQQPFPLVSTILVRTLMDTRYYYGVRVIAALALARCATPTIDWLGLKHLEKVFQEFYCFQGSNMTKSNDFSDHRMYWVQCAIIQAMGQVRDLNGKTPDRVKQFLLDKLKFNDNSNNHYVDDYYVTSLLSCLTQSLVKSGSSSNNHSQSQTVSYEQEVRDAEFIKIALEELQRIRRVDQWIPSFQNLYTVTVLDSMQIFMQNGVLPRRVTDFYNFTHPANSDTVRLKAYNCLIELGEFTKSLKFFLFSFFTEPSPIIRRQLWRLISRGLGRMAIAVPETEISPEPINESLIIEDVGVAEDSKQAAIAKAQTLSGAIANLIAQVSDMKILRTQITSALQSPILGAEDFLNVLTLCRILYEPQDSYIVTMKIPQYWRVKNYNGGLVTFKQTGKHRTKPWTTLDSRLPKAMKVAIKRAAENSVDPSTEVKKIKIATTSENIVQDPKPVIQLVLKQAPSSQPQPQLPSQPQSKPQPQPHSKPQSQTQSQSQPAKLKLKLVKTQPTLEKLNNVTPKKKSLIIKLKLRPALLQSLKKSSKPSKKQVTKINRSSTEGNGTLFKSGSSISFSKKSEKPISNTTTIQDEPTSAISPLTKSSTIDVQFPSEASSSLQESTTKDQLHDPTSISLADSNRNEPNLNSPTTDSNDNIKSEMKAPSKFKLKFKFGGGSAGSDAS